MKTNLKPFDVFVLLAAFLYGNLFVINFSKLDWGVVLLASIVLLVEFANTLLYSSFFEKAEKERPKTLGFKKQSEQKLLNFFPFSLKNTQNEFFKKRKKKILWRSRSFSFALVINTIKRGFLLGFFIEAFKVGS